MNTALNLTGMKFGRWTVESFHGRNERGEKTWNCQCSCGTKRTVRYGHLSQGRTTSCGCLSIEMTKVRNRTHGQSKTNVYNVWNTMITRCNNPNSEAYLDYGARGIKVCDRWMIGCGGMSGFECFILDMGERPNGMSIERVDNEGNYESDNCRWETRRVQSRNKRNSIYVMDSGEEILLLEFIDRHPEIKRGTIYARNKSGRNLLTGKRI